MKIHIARFTYVRKQDFTSYYDCCEYICEEVDKNHVPPDNYYLSCFVTQGTLLKKIHKVVNIDVPDNISKAHYLSVLQEHLNVNYATNLPLESDLYAAAHTVKDQETSKQLSSDIAEGRVFYGLI